MFDDGTEEVLIVLNVVHSVPVVNPALDRDEVDASPLGWALAALNELAFLTAIEQYERKQRRRIMKEDFSAIEVYIRYGLPGTGKTSYAYEYAKKHHGGSIYRLPTNSGTNFGSYNGESVVLFDDVKAGEVPSVSTIKKLTDRYPDEVRVLYGWIPWKPRVIFITSNWEPGTWWPDLNEVDYDAVSRRVASVTEVFKKKSIIHFKNGVQTEETVYKKHVEEVQEDPVSHQEEELSQDSEIFSKDIRPPSPSSDQDDS